MKELLRKARSVRRFAQTPAMTADDMKEMAEALRFTPSAGNLQRIRFALITEKENRDAVFAGLKFAAYLKDWEGPKPDERPTSYLVLLTQNVPDTNLAIDVGIVSEAAVLYAAQKGFGTCILANFDRKAVSEMIGAEGWQPVLVLAFGTPSETVVTTDVAPGENIRYYRDEADTHVVPKLRADTLILREM